MLAFVLAVLVVASWYVQRPLIGLSLPNRRIRNSLPLLAVACAALIALLATLFFLVCHMNVAAAVSGITGLLLVMGLLAADYKDPFAKGGIALAFLGLLFIVFLLVPIELGRKAARQDRNNPNRLPMVQLAATRTLGLDGERKEGELFLIGPLRLILVNDGNLWLTVSDRDGAPIYQVADSDIASVTYLGEMPSDVVLTATPAVDQPE